VRDRVQGGDIFRRDGARTLARTIEAAVRSKTDGRYFGGEYGRFMRTPEPY
jgi:hypothetical protein